MAGLKIKKGDRVRVLTGKDRGHEGEVMRVIPSTGKVIVDGANVAKKHQRATKATMQGGIIDKDMPLPGGQRGAALPELRQGHPGRLHDRQGRHQGPRLQEVRR